MRATRVWAAAAMLLVAPACKKYDRGNYKTAPGYLKGDTVTNFVEGMVMGQPYDSILESPVASAAPAVTFTEVKDAPGLLNSSFTMKLIQSDEELMKSLDLSVGIGYSGAVVNLDNKFTFAMSHKVNSQSLYLLVSAKMAGRAQQLADPVLTEEAKRLTAEQFYNRYGDRYAYAVVGGAEIHALIEFKTKSTEDKMALSNTFGASAWGVTVDASVEAKMETARKNTSVDVQVLAVGAMPITVALDGIGPNINAFLDEVRTWLRDLQALPAADRMASQTLRMHYRGYFGLEGYPGLPAGVEAKVEQHRQAASDYLVYRSLVDKELASYYLDPAYEGDPVLTELARHADALDDHLTAWARDSQNPPPTPAVSPAASLESFATTELAIHEPDLHVYRFANGFIPRRLTDYDLPARYATAGKLRGVRVEDFHFMPVRAPEDESPLPWHLYLVNEPGQTGVRKVLAYRWKGGGAAYFVDVDDLWTGSPDQIPSSTSLRDRLDRLTIAEWTREGDRDKQFLLVNTANGLVLQKGAQTVTDTYAAELQPFTGASNQRWGFHMPSGSATYQDPGTCLDPLACPGDPVSVGSWDGVQVVGASTCWCCLYVIGCWKHCCNYCSSPTTQWLSTSPVVESEVQATLLVPDQPVQAGCPLPFKGNLVHFLAWPRGTPPSATTPEGQRSTGTRTLRSYCSGDTSFGSDGCTIGQGLYAQGSGGGELLLVGGRAGGAASSSTLHWARPETGTGGAWTAFESLPAARSKHTATVLASGGMLVVGGEQAATDGFLLEATPAGVAWTTVATPLPSGLVDHTATLLRNGQVLVAGGQTATGGPRTEAWLYTPPPAAAAGWVQTGSLPGGRSGHSATLLASGEVLVLGGRDAGDAPVASAAVYDPEAGTWATSRLTLAVPRSHHTATLLQQGGVLVVGGRGTGATTVSTAELFDPEATTCNPVDELRDTAGLPQGRWLHTATLLPSGDVLVVGGQTGTGSAFLDSVLFRPGTGTWDHGGPQLAQPRAGHTATVVAPGVVAIVGGQEAAAAGVGNQPALTVAVYAWNATTKTLTRGDGPVLPDGGRIDHAAVPVVKPPSGSRPFVNVGVKAASQTCDPALDCWSAGQRARSLHDPAGDVPRLRGTPANQQWRIVPIENVEHF